MPPLDASSSENTARPFVRTLSKVNSLKRTWDDEEKGKDGEIPWSPSPPDMNRRQANNPQPIPKPTSAPAPTDAAARRRAAIMAALSSDLLSSTAQSAGPSSSVAGPSSLGGVAASSFYGAPASSTSSGVGKKRPADSQPWSADSLHGAKRIAPPPSTTALNGNLNKWASVKAKIILSSEQQKVLSMVVDEGKSMFFTGSAGTGKSVLLREIISGLRRKYSSFPDAVAVTASTGIAACNIGGVTLHSFGGVGLGQDKPEKLVGFVRKNKKAVNRWLRTKVLIIDEVSMVDGEFFDALAKVGSLIRKSSKAFGGMQVVVTGDFFQLPPVQKSGQPTFAFEAQTWAETISASVNLTQVFRQKDQTFVDMLNEMRFGRMTGATIQRFKTLCRPVHYDDGLGPTQLFPTRQEVDKANTARLGQLQQDIQSYIATDGPGNGPNSARDKLLGNMMAPPSIILKVGAQVMLIKNIDETLVNGSMGKVIGFCLKHQYVEIGPGKWGMEAIDKEGGEEDPLEAGAARKKKPAAGEISMKQLPVVRFSVPGKKTRDMLVDYDTFKNELPNGEIQASRVQLPLILAWAMSIHKSQGQTLDRVKVDLGRVFEKGQAYVALSRATCLEGLEVYGFQEAKVMAHPKVTQWSKQLQSLA